ncbi:MAG TPA: serine/threonine-protein kinase [Polyangiaceae bacterium]
MDADGALAFAPIGRYHPLRLLGRGAMGRVLLAHDPVVDRQVAIKLLRDDLVIPPEQKDALIDRMRQEARASARVSHPNIVNLHDMGEDPELGLYLVFEYAEGLTLEQRIAQGPLGPEAGAKLARELGDALTTAHAAGVLHRDIKPQNIILTATGAKIADFGIARVPDSTLTRDGGLLGTPAYSAPESIAKGTFSPLSDQFSLAATLYEALSQRRAFPGEDAVSVATRITHEVPPGIADSCDLDQHVDAILLRGLAKPPAERFSSARELGETLAEALAIPTRKMLPTLPDEHHRRAPWQARPENHGLRTAVGGAAIGALVGVAALQLSTMLREPEPPASGDAPSHVAVAWIYEKPAPTRLTPETAPSAPKRPRAAVSNDAAVPAPSEPSEAKPSEPSDAGVRIDGPDDVP